MKTSSCKAKGRGFQDKIRDLMRKYAPQVAPEDISGQIMGVGGEDIRMSSKARESYPISVECKKNKAFAVYKFYEQAQRNCGEYEPVVFIEADRKTPLALVDAEFLIKLIAEREPCEKISENSK